MPWDVKPANKDASEHCVYDEDGKQLKCYSGANSWSKARKYQKALYANVDEAKDFSHLFKELVEEDAESVARITKEDGRYVIETVSTAALPDREEETFTTAAMDYDIQKAYETGEFPEYRVFHSPALGIGRVEEMRRIGIFAYDRGYSYDDPFSLQVCEKMLMNNSDGRWRTSRGFKAEEVSGLCPNCRSDISIRKKHMLVGFRCPACRSVHLGYRGILKDVRFQRARTFDITVTDVPVVPYTSASAFPMSELLELKQMDRNALKQRLVAAGIDEDDVEERLKSVPDSVFKEWDDVPEAVLKDFAKGYKTDKTAEEVDEEDEEDEEEEEEEEEMEKSEDVVLSWEQMKNELAGVVAKSFKETLADFEVELADVDFDVELKSMPEMADLGDRLKQLEKKVDQLLADDEERLKQLADEAPRQAMFRVRQFKSTDVEDEEEEEESPDPIQKHIDEGNAGRALDGEGREFGSMSEFLLGSN